MHIPSITPRLSVPLRPASRRLVAHSPSPAAELVKDMTTWALRGFAGASGVFTFLFLFDFLYSLIGH
ncbi:hypothetical protein [Microvirgula aerodenitrificans]|uniref:hypothetical protein n=1 Tax=Microvirgula aerodenitrificans TaxID=57480 RepID=UPI00248D8B11|nr:hypothetical protein [Microvirgula aerodenitrificans]